MLTLHSFDGLNGRHVTRLPFTACSWQDTINEDGTMSATLPNDPVLARIDLAVALRDYGSIIALTDGQRILHAGWLTHHKPDEQDTGWQLDIAGGWKILSKRPVLRKAILDKWQDGEVLIDEDNPPGDWVLKLAGTYRDIARGLVSNALDLGTLPYRLPDIQGGKAHELAYNGWELAMTDERLGDLTDRQDGPEIRFDPKLEGDHLYFALTVGDREIIDHKWQWNAQVPASGVTLSGYDADGEDAATCVIGVGGKTEDKTLMAMSRGNQLTKLGWPALYETDTTHSTVSDLKTLKSYVDAMLDMGDQPQHTIGVKCRRTHDVHIGDWIDLRLPSASIARRQLGVDVAKLKVTDISGNAGEDMLALQCRIRGEQA